MPPRPQHGQHLQQMCVLNAAEVAGGGGDVRTAGRKAMEANGITGGDGVETCTSGQKNYPEALRPNVICRSCRGCPEQTSPSDACA